MPPHLEIYSLTNAMSHLPLPLSLGPNEVGRPAPLPLNDGPPRPPRPPVMLSSCSLPHLGKAPLSASGRAASLKDVGSALSCIFSTRVWSADSGAHP